MLMDAQYQIRVQRPECWILDNPKYLLNCHWDPGLVKSQISVVATPSPLPPPAVTITGLPEWTLLWNMPHPWLLLTWFIEGPMVVLKLLLASNSLTVDLTYIPLLKLEFWDLWTSPFPTRIHSNFDVIFKILTGKFENQLDIQST